MRISTPAMLAFVFAATAATLDGCGGGASQTAPVGPIQQDDGLSTLAFHSANADVRVDRGKSWMAPDAKKNQLLYVSDLGTSDVVVYRYPSLSEAGVLTGFDGPQGECVDKAGDVWIANTLTSSLLEYAHGGRSPIASLSDPGQFPVACSVNGVDGTLAVANVLPRTRHDRRGSLSLYAHAMGNPKIVTSPNFKEVYFLGYDDRGNLFLDGYDHNHHFQYGEMGSGSNAIKPITLVGASVRFPGGVGFADGRVNIGDQLGAVIYEATETGTVTGSTLLGGSSDCVQFFIQGNAVICPDSGNGDIEIYSYPSGGSPIGVTTGLVSPDGSAVSHPP